MSYSYIKKIIRGNAPESVWNVAMNSAKWTSQAIEQNNNMLS